MVNKDYLAKYKGKVSKPKKKSNVIVEKDTSLSVEHDDAIKIHSKFKGFKRIDGKAKDVASSQSSSSTTSSSSSSTKQPPSKTVYRDLSGRIVDPNAISSSSKPQNPTIIKEVSPPPIISAPKSFTVDKYDPEYNNTRKTRQLLDDPMSNYTASSNSSSSHLDYKDGVSPLNRFNIKAGILWDGIDRSNGFEIKVVRKRNETKVARHNVDDAYDFDYD